MIVVRKEGKIIIVNHIHAYPLFVRLPRKSSTTQKGKGERKDKGRFAGEKEEERIRIKEKSFVENSLELRSRFPRTNERRRGW